MGEIFVEIQFKGRSVQDKKWLGATEMDKFRAFPVLICGEQHDKANLLEPKSKWGERGKLEEDNLLLESEQYDFG